MNPRQGFCDNGNAGNLWRWDGVFWGVYCSIRKLLMLILLSTLICFTYHFSERANGYELSEYLNKPLSPQYNCVAVSDNHTKVMIEIQHCGNFILVFDKAKRLDITLKLFEV